MIRVGHLTVDFVENKLLAFLSIGNEIVFSSGSVSDIAKEIRRRGITLVGLDNGASFTVPSTYKSMASVSKYSSHNNFFIRRLISECM